MGVLDYPEGPAYEITASDGYIKARIAVSISDMGDWDKEGDRDRYQKWFDAMEYEIGVHDRRCAVGAPCSYCKMAWGMR